MRTIGQQRRFGVDVLIACLAGALAGCGSVSPAGSGTGGGAGSGHGGAIGAGGTTGSAGTTGVGGTTGAGGTTGVGGSDGTGGTTGAGGSGGICTVLCMNGRTCCGNNTCLNLQNDPFNCGKCGNVCMGTTSYCTGGMCQAPICATPPGAGVCSPNSSCCGAGCCGPGQLCCDPQGPIGGEPTCYTPTPDQPTCPQGCAPSCKSDRNVKKDIAPVDTQAILDKVARLPISTWTYLEEPAGVRHLGPMAQDFHASFGLGNDDRTYSSVDAHGVALAAIQALERVVAAQEKRIQALERENRRLEGRARPPRR